MHGADNVSNVPLTEMLKDKFALSDLENKDGSYHSFWHGYIHRKEAKYENEYQDIVEAITEELDFKEAEL